jgi:hypothetical protein
MSGNVSPGSEAGDLPPPSWEQLDGERRQSEAYDRRNLATPVQMKRGPVSEPVTPELAVTMGEVGDGVVQGDESVMESTHVTETHTAAESGSVEETQSVKDAEVVKETDPTMEIKPNNE